MIPSVEDMIAEMSHPAEVGQFLRSQAPAAAGRPQAQADAKAQNQEGPGVGPRPPSIKTIRDVLIPANLRLAAGGSPGLDPVNFRLYRDALIIESGAKGVLEQMLVEQLALAHLASCRLLAAAHLSDSAEADGIRAGAAAKLMGAVRRTVVALKEFHSPPAPPTINVATTQQVNVTGTTATAASVKATEKSDVQSRVGSNNGLGSNRMREILREDACGSPEPAAVGAAD